MVPILAAWGLTPAGETRNTGTGKLQTFVIYSIKIYIKRNNKGQEQVISVGKIIYMGENYSGFTALLIF